MWATLIAKLVGTLPESVVGYYREKNQLKQELKKAKLQGKIDLARAAVERRIAEQAHAQTWEMAYLGMQAKSYKDEIVLAVFLWPLVGVFVPVVQDYVMVGFDYLGNIPAWWVGLTVAISLAIYGIRHKNANRIAAPGLKDADVNSVKRSD